jgi:hypothetical protein
LSEIQYIKFFLQEKFLKDIPRRASGVVVRAAAVRMQYPPLAHPQWDGTQVALPPLLPTKTA